MANAPITYVSPGFQFTSCGPEWLAFIYSPTSVNVVYSDTGAGAHTDIIVSSPAIVLNLDGSLSNSVTINRITNSWLLCARKNTTQLLIVQEYLFPVLDSMLGGDQNYAILARVLHHEILPFQNV